MVLKEITRVADCYATFARWVAIVSGLVVLLLMLYTTVDVAGRYLFNKPVPAAYEMTVMFLIYITYFGITLVQARGGHMRLGFLWDIAGPRGRALIDLLSVLIGLFLFGIATWQGWLWAIDAWKIGETSMGAYEVPLFPGRIALAIGATIFIGQYLIDLVRNFVILVSHNGTTDKIGQEPENVIK